MTSQAPNISTKNTAIQIMGIVNLTPDSFSDGGLFCTQQQEFEFAENLSAQGADILDIGGESTRPGSKPISVEEELTRIEPLVARIAKRRTLSIDTYKAKTASRCLELGAHIINDVSAMRADPNMVSVIREHSAQVVLMYSKEPDHKPHASEAYKDYQDVIGEILQFFDRRIEYALSNGIKESQIILDPGMGKFVSHDPKYSWEILKRFEEFKILSSKFPFLIGTSRKGFLGGEISERDPISQFTATCACLRGAKFIRTHNVAMAREFISALGNMAETQ